MNPNLKLWVQIVINIYGGDKQGGIKHGGGSVMV